MLLLMQIELSWLLAKSRFRNTIASPSRPDANHTMGTTQLSSANISRTSPLGLALCCDDSLMSCLVGTKMAKCKVRGNQLKVSQDANSAGFAFPVNHESGRCFAT